MELSVELCERDLEGGAGEVGTFAVAGMGTFQGFPDQAAHILEDGLVRNIAFHSAVFACSKEPLPGYAASGIEAHVLKSLGSWRSRQAADDGTKIVKWANTGLCHQSCGPGHFVIHTKCK